MWVQQIGWRCDGAAALGTGGRRGSSDNLDKVCLTHITLSTTIFYRFPTMHFNNLRRTEANLLHSICVGGECKTDSDGNSLVQQCESLQAVTGSIISLSHDALWLQCLKTSQGCEYLEFTITVSSEYLEKAVFWLHPES